MAIVNGTFTPTVIQAIQMKITEALTLDNSISRLYKGYVPETFNALNSAQLARVTVLENPDTDQDVKIQWFEQVQGSVTEAAVTNCSFTGTEGGTESQTYTMNASYNKAFKINSGRARTNEFKFNDEFAQLFLQTDWEISKHMNTKAVAFLEANIGTSLYAPSFNVSNDGSGIVIPAANYNKQLMSHLVASKQINRLGAAPVNITGGSFFHEYFNAQNEFANADGKDTLNKLAAVGTWAFDIEELVADADDPIYQVSPMAYAFANKVKAQYTAGAPTKGMADERYFYRLESQFMPGVFYQITERYVCSNNDEWDVHVAMQLNGKFFLHPQSVNSDTNTGIIKWLKETA